MQASLSIVPVLLAWLPMSASDLPPCIFDVVEAPPKPVLRNGDAGTEDNKYGFEGGRVLKHNGSYHLFTAEMSGEPRWVTIPLEPKVKKWWQLMRTPLCLIPEGKDVFTVFYTAWAPGGGYSCLGEVKLRLNRRHLDVPDPRRTESRPRPE